MVFEKNALFSADGFSVLHSCRDKEQLSWSLQQDPKKLMISSFHFNFTRMASNGILQQIWHAERDLKKRPCLLCGHICKGPPAARLACIDAEALLKLVAISATDMSD